MKLASWSASPFGASNHTARPGQVLVPEPYTSTVSPDSLASTISVAPAEGSPQMQLAQDSATGDALTVGPLKLDNMFGKGIATSSFLLLVTNGLQPTSDDLQPRPHVQVRPCNMLKQLLKPPTPSCLTTLVSYSLTTEATRRPSPKGRARARHVGRWPL